MSKEITGTTMLTGLLGSPVSHSISPAMHNEAFKLLDLDYVYLAFDVSNDDLETAVNGLRALNVRGFNLTMPFKNKICSLCDEISPVAKITGSVNTVVHKNGILSGHTTDGIGFMRSVTEHGFNIIGKKMTILGAGGAASSIVAQAAFDGVLEISIFNHHSSSFIHMENMIRNLQLCTNCNFHLYDYSDPCILKKEIQESAILVNATPVGMSPDISSSMIVDPHMFHEHLIVTDIIYHPKKTKLLQLAEKAGCPSFNGLSMLLYQGAEAFRLWTGREMPVSDIRKKISNFNLKE